MYRIIKGSKREINVPVLLSSYWVPDIKSALKFALLVMLSKNVRITAVLGFLVSWYLSMISCAGYSRLSSRDISFGLLRLPVLVRSGTTSVHVIFACLDIDFYFRMLPQREAGKFSSLLLTIFRLVYPITLLIFSKRILFFIFSL